MNLHLHFLSGSSVKQMLSLHNISKLESDWHSSLFTLCNGVPCSERQMLALKFRGSTSLWFTSSRLNVYNITFIYGVRRRWDDFEKSYLVSIPPQQFLSLFLLLFVLTYWPGFSAYFGLRRFLCIRICVYIYIVLLRCPLSTFYLSGEPRALCTPSDELPSLNVPASRNDAWCFSNNWLYSCNCLRYSR